MKPQCKQAIEQHLTNVTGQAVVLTDAAIKRIEARFKEGGKVLANRDRATWQTLTPDERTIEIGKWVREQEQVAADATARSKQRQVSAIVKGMQRVQEFADQRPDKAGKWGAGVIDYLEGVDNTVRGAELSALRGFGELVEASKSGSVFDFASTKSDAFYADVVREIYGKDTGNADAKQFATKWSENMDGLREARNRAGGTVGKLEHYAPQTHNPTIMQRSGMRDRWIGYMMKNLDREKYLDETGVALDDKALQKVVEKMYTTIVSDGVNKITTDVNGLAETSGGGGASNMAKALNSQHREIHLKDADAVIEYNKQFHSDSLGATFFKHMQGQARDVALIQEMGPNPELAHATLRDTAKIRDAAMPGAEFKNGEVKGGSRAGMTSDAYLRSIMGHQEFATLDEISSALTAYQAATKLTSTALRAPFQDTPGILLNAADVGQLKNIGTIMRTAFNKKEAARFGIGAEVAAQSALQGSQRIMSQGRFNVANSLSRYAQATMKYTGLDAWTNAVRRAGQTSHALALGEWSHMRWDQLDAGQRGLLNNAGIVADDWAHIQSMPRQQLRGHDVHDVTDAHTLGLSPDDAASLQNKMMGFVRMGGDITTSEHNLTAQTIMSMGGRSNALTKQTMLFKNAGAVQTAHMLDRFSRATRNGKVGYFAATLSMGVGVGYMALAAQALTAGQRPPEFTDWRTIGKAMAVTGGFAMVQDMITSAYDAMSGNNSGHSSSAIPIFGDLATLGKIGLKAANGETSEAGYMSMKMLRQQVAPLNYWYAKAAVDHLFFNDAAEALNPGYNKRLRKYADQKGQQYFWDPQGGFSGSGVTGEYRKPLEL